MSRQVDDPQSDHDNYDENEDEDFNPEVAAVDDDASSSEDDEDHTRVKRTGQKRKVNAVEELDSGDEATIKERKRRKKRQEKDEDSGGEESLIKTRAQRLAEKIERKERRRTPAGAVTVDVEALWADLNRLPIGNTLTHESSAPNDEAKDSDLPDRKPTTLTQGTEFIKIKRRIEFAGEVTEVEQEVHRESKEARKYLSERSEMDIAFRDDIEVRDGIHRPLRRQSLFEPNPLGLVKGVPPEKLRKRAPSRMDILMAESRVEEERRRKAEKMSTVQKSALDWKGFIVEQGFGDELNEYGKSKKGFLDREQFLDKVHGVNEDARKAARLKG